MAFQVTGETILEKDMTFGKIAIIINTVRNMYVQSQPSC